LISVQNLDLTISLVELCNFDIVAAFATI
jgi:hypothetical protein